ncbi:MAG: cytochrome c-type biogenesis protein CcmH [Solirubrobacteraceae bacterium]
MNPRRAAIAAALLLAWLAPTAAIAAPPQRASLTDLEQQVMCVTCGVPLAIAESPQAERERAYIRGLIASGESSAQIKRDLVGQYGPNVIALPQRRGFDLVVYLAPIALVLALLGALAVALPRWRRRTATAAAAPSRTPRVSAQESEQLDADLARYEH